jgi:F-type H+-transporting ATPase subunit b
MSSRLLFLGVLGLAVGLCCVATVSAQEHDAGDHDHPAVAESEPGHEQVSNGNAHAASDGDSHDAGAHHDPFEETLHSNAGPSQGSFTEIRASLAFWTLVVFGLLLLILWKFAWGPLTEALDRREAGILANIAAAKEQNDRAAALLAEHEARLAGTADEVRHILDQARRDADLQKQGIIADAQAAAESEKHRAVQEIEAAKNSALRELAEKSVDTALGLAGKIVQRQLSPDDHASLIAEALEHFPSRN